MGLQSARRRRRPSRLLHRTSRITAATPTVSSRQLPSIGNIIAFREVGGLHHTPRASGHRSLQRTPACRGTADSSPLLCLDEPRIAQRGGLCRHGGGLSGCGAARRAISAQVRARARYGFYRFWRVCGFSAQPHTAFFEPVSHSGMDRCAKDATCEGPEQIDLAALAGDLLQNCSRHFGRPTDLPLLVVIVRLRRR